MSANDTALNLALIGGAGIAAYVLVKRFGNKLGDVAGEVGNAFNPASNTNLVSRGADGAVSAVAGSETSIGSLLFDWVQRLRGIPPYDPNAPAIEFAIDTPENVSNERNRRDPNIFLLDPFGPSVEEQLRRAGLA